MLLYILVYLCTLAHCAPFITPGDGSPRISHQARGIPMGNPRVQQFHSGRENYAFAVKIRDVEEFTFRNVESGTSIFFLSAKYLWFAYQQPLGGVEGQIRQEMPGSVGLGTVIENENLSASGNP